MGSLNVQLTNLQRSNDRLWAFGGKFAVSYLSTCIRREILPIFTALGRSVLRYKDIILDSIIYGRSRGGIVLN